MRHETRFREPNKLYFIEDVSHIRAVLKYNRIPRYIIYPEFDEKGRLHYHGILALDSNQYIRFYKHAMHKLKRIGFVDVKPLKTFKDKLRWICYIKKSFGTTREILSIEDPVMVMRYKVHIHHTDFDNPSILDYFKDTDM